MLSTFSSRIARTRLDLDSRSKFFAPTRPSFQVQNFRPDSTWFQGQHFNPENSDPWDIYNFRNIEKIIIKWSIYSINYIKK